MASRKAFEDTIQHSMSLRNISFNDAMADVQAKYEAYMNNNRGIILEQDRQSNTAQLQLTSHFALLATLSLTVVGFLFQSATNLTDSHRILIVMILVSQTISLSFGAYDYIRTIFFHRGWSKAYQEVGSEINKQIDSGKIQYISDLGKIETSIISKQQATTPIWISYIMVAACLIGLVSMILLFIAYLFDVPIWSS